MGQKFSRNDGVITLPGKKNVASVWTAVIVVLVVLVLILGVFSYSEDTSIKGPIASAIADTCVPIKYHNDRNYPMDFYQPIRQIGFVKMHKTGSTTFANILMHVAWRHDLNIFAEVHTRLQIGETLYEKGQSLYHTERPAVEDPLDIIAIHVSGSDYMDSFEPDYTVQELYSTYFHDIPCGHIVITVRDPVKRYISFRNYLEKNIDLFQNPFDQQHVRHLLGLNGMSKTLGITTQEQMDVYISSEQFQNTFFIITEDFIKSLVLLKNTFHWSMEDLLHVKLHDACKDGVRYDGKKIKCNAKMNIDESWDVWLTEKHNLDYDMYNAAVAHMKTIEDKIPAALIETQQFELTWKLKQLAERCVTPLAGTYVSATFNPTKEQMETDACTTYLMNDVTYERILELDFESHFVPEFDQVKYMQDYVQAFGNK